MCLVAVGGEVGQVDRLNKAVRVSGLSVARLARAAAAVHRNTIGNYFSGRTQADKRTLMHGVGARDGRSLHLADRRKTPADGQGPDEGAVVVRREGIEPPTR